MILPYFAWPNKRPPTPCYADIEYEQQISFLVMQSPTLMLHYYEHISTNF